MTTESKLIAALVDGDQDKIESIVSKITDWEYFLKIAAANRLLYPASQKLLQGSTQQLPTETRATLKTIVSEGGKILDNNSQALRDVARLFEKKKIEFLAIKTFKNYEHVFHDIDLLIRREDFERSIESISHLSSTPIHRGDGQASAVHKNDTKLDLHQEFRRYGHSRLRTDFLWNNPRVATHGDSKVDIPSFEAEFMLTLANIAFERYYFPFLDFLYLKYLSENITDLRFCERSAREGGWEQSYKAIYSEFKTLNLEDTFPRLLSVRTLLTAFSEVFASSEFNKKKVLRGFLYWIFSGLRFRITSGRRVPMYGDWFNFARIK